MTEYLYQPLSSESGCIRLMQLQPPEPGSDDIKCDIFDACLADNPLYTALSYCWASSAAPYSISVGSCRLAITASLYVALRSLQHKAPLTLWVDAICINQHNAVEKAFQVSEMRHIYQSAEYVIAWLGSSADGSDEAMKWIEHFGQWAYRLEIGSRRELYLSILLEQWERSPLSYEHTEMNRFLSELCQSLLTVPGKLDATATESLARLLNRQYWKRMWVVQEVYNGNYVEFVCGKMTVHEEELNAALRLLRNIQYYKRIRSTGFVGFDKLDTYNAVTLLKMRRAGRRGAALPLIYLLRHFRKAECALKVDRIFALQGLAADTDELGIRPDYTSTEEDIFMRLARALIRLGYSEVLSLCNNRDRLPTLPSWVPDWSSYKRQVFLQQRAIGRSEVGLADSTEVQPNFNACGSLPLMIAIDATSPITTLTMLGVRIGRLSAVGPHFESSTAGKWLQWLVEHGQARSLHHTERLQTACVTAVADQQVRNGPRKLRSNPDVLQKVHSSLETWPDDLLVHLRQSGLNDYCQQLQEVGVGRKPFSINTELVGIGPDHAEFDDVVYVVAGARVPLVSRPFAGTPNFQLIGEAYVHGVMDGEAATPESRIELLRIV